MKCKDCYGSGTVARVGSVLVTVERCEPCGGRGHICEGEPVWSLEDGRYWSHDPRSKPWWWKYGADGCYHAYARVPEGRGDFITALCGSYETDSSETKTPGSPACGACWAKAGGVPT